MKSKIFLFFLSVTTFFHGSALFAGNVSLHGFVQGEFSVRTNGEAPQNSEGGDFLLGEERLRLDLSAHDKSGVAGMESKVDFFHDALTNTANIDLREAYAEFTSKYIDFRMGRQIITWGVGDLLFINDVFPKDWAAFFSGQPLEYLKIGSDAIKIVLYPKIFSLKLVVTPIFRQDNLPTSARFFLFDPFPSVTARQTVLPTKSLKNVEVAVRIQRDIAGFDTSIYFSKGFWRTPGALLNSITAPTEISYVFPKLLTYGLSTQRAVLGGVFSLESGYYDSLDDRNGNDYSTPNSQARYFLGYKHPLWKEATLGFQYYGEYMFHHGAYQANLPAGFPVQDRLRQLVTASFTQMLAHQTLKLSLFSFFSPSDLDYQIIPEVQYHFTDELWAALGGNIFGGKKNNTFFGQMDKNDNVYLILRYEF